MEPLIRITTVPIKYELKIERAKLEYKRSVAQLETRRKKGQMSMKSRQIKVHIDTYDARNSVCPTTMEKVRQSAAEGKAAASEAAATYAKEGALLLDSEIPNPLDQIISQRAQMPSGDFGLQFLPATGPDLEWSDPELNIQYQMDKLSFELKVAKGDVEFIPGKVEFSTTQMPDVKIEYLGKPIYVPPSAVNLFHHDPVDLLA